MRPVFIGTALAKLATSVEEALRQGEDLTVSWYQGTKTLRVLSGVCLWHTPALPPRLPI